MPSLHRGGGWRLKAAERGVEQLAEAVRPGLQRGAATLPCGCRHTGGALGWQASLLRAGKLPQRHLLMNLGHTWPRLLGEGERLLAERPALRVQGRAVLPDEDWDRAALGHLHDNPPRHAPERSLASDDHVGDAAEGENVGARHRLRERLIKDHLRRHRLKGSAERLRISCEQPREAEVQELRLGDLGLHEDVRALQVAMDDAWLERMEVAQRASDVQQQPKADPDLLVRGVQEHVLGEVGALEPFQDEHHLARHGLHACAVEEHDVAMSDLSQDTNFVGDGDEVSHAGAVRRSLRGLDGHGGAVQRAAHDDAERACAQDLVRSDLHVGGAHEPVLPDAEGGDLLQALLQFPRLILLYAIKPAPDVDVVEEATCSRGLGPGRGDRLPLVQHSRPLLILFRLLRL
mmetsp:Transcript_97002/g.301960  ORF Transcript_97002/g.301960 Transcript_97002/m.301960 type:complete len:404 (-) Transcript_97002:99-1310(-)